MDPAIFFLVLVRERNPGMSGTLKSERDPAPLRGATGHSGPSAPVSAGMEIRLDPAHLPNAGQSIVPLDPGIDAGGEYPDDIRPESSARNATDAPVPPRGNYDRLLLQANQIAEHVKHQCAELDRREQRLHTQLVQLDQERRNVRMWVEQFDADVHDRESILAEREAACAEKTAACLQLDQELQELHQTLLRERHALQVAQEQFTQERDQTLQELEAERLESRRLIEADRLENHQQIEAERAEFQSELETQQSQFRREVEEQRHELQVERERLQTEFKQERVLLENRLKFQQDHLQRARQEFEGVQTEFRVEQQVARVRAEQTFIQQSLRQRQLARVRDLWESRERSVERERSLLEKSRRALEERFLADHEALAYERATWESERDTQRSDLRRQQDLLALHAENLEARRTRLDNLRTELEETNRTTLEMRLAIEEAFAQLSQAAGADAAQRRVDEARRILAEHYRYTRDALTHQRQEIEDLHGKLQEQRHELHNERQSLADWLVNQETELREREHQLANERQSWEASEQTRDAARERWLRERLEAETIIRDLLSQLTEFSMIPTDGVQMATANLNAAHKSGSNRSP